MITDTVSANLRTYWEDRHTIPGLLEDIDFLLFDWLLRQQAASQTAGDLLEIGAFHGKSAIVVGAHLGPGERFVVCDIFGGDTDSDANAQENVDSYAGSGRAIFEANYRRFVHNQPTVVQALSSELPAHVAAETLRFAHIDGGHLFDQVAEDLANVKRFLKTGGVVVLDDFRAHHTPGVAAAVWRAVALDGLVPAVVTETKFYGAFDVMTAAHLRDGAEVWLRDQPKARFGRQSVGGHELLVVANPRIWTKRRRIRHLLPPIVAERLRPTPESHLGS